MKYEIYEDTLNAVNYMTTSHRSTDGGRVKRRRRRRREEKMIVVVVWINMFRNEGNVSMFYGSVGNIKNFVSPVFTS